MLDPPVLRFRRSKVTAKEKNILVYGDQGGKLSGNGVKNHLALVRSRFNRLPAAFFTLRFWMGFLVGDHGKGGKAYGQ